MKSTGTLYSELDENGDILLTYIIVRKEIEDILFLTIPRFQQSDYDSITWDHFVRHEDYFVNNCHDYFYQQQLSFEIVSSIRPDIIQIQGHNIIISHNRDENDQIEFKKLCEIMIRLILPKEQSQ